MARVNGIVSVQRGEASDGLQQLPGVPRRKIRPSDGFLKQRIAREQIIIQQLANAAAGVPGRMQNADLSAGKRDRVAVADSQVGAFRARKTAENRMAQR